MLNELQAEVKTLSAEAQAIITAANGGALSDPDFARLNELNEKVGALESKIARVAEQRALGARMSALAASMPAAAAAGAMVKAAETGMVPAGYGLGDALVESHEFKALIQRGFSGRFNTGAISVETKAVVAYPAGGILQGTLVPPIPQYLFPWVTDLPSQGTAAAGMIPAFTLDSFTNAAAPVGHGLSKPESGLDVTQTLYPMVTMAHWIQVPNQLLEDAPALRTYINSQMLFGLRRKEDNQVLNGSTAASILGYNTIAAANPAGPAAGVDEALSVVVLQAIAQSEAASGLPVDGIVMNPADWGSILTQRAGATGPMLVTQMSPFLPLPSQLWGRRVVTSPYQPQGKVLVGPFASGSILFRNGSITVSASNEDRDNFIKNITTILAESRLALVVMSKLGFVQATGVPPVTLSERGNGKPAALPEGSDQRELNGRSKREREAEERR